MSHQAHLDAVETMTGRTPRQLLDLAAERGYGPTTKAAEVRRRGEPPAGVLTPKTPPAATRRPARASPP